MIFPTLYKKTSTGSIQEWTISVVKPSRPNYNDVAIKTVHGQINGKLQETIDFIKEGKNAGRANATTPIEQAVLEAKSKWEKKLKTGHAQTIEDAQVGKVDAVIEGGMVPMLAQNFSKHGEKITFPCFVQPKLDGIRCIATIIKGKATLWSRTRKPIMSVPHIIAELEACFPSHLEDVILDGELYNHAFKDNFEHIVHLVRQTTPDPEHEDVQYHIYDVVSNQPFLERTIFLEHRLSEEFSHLIRVETVPNIESVEHLMQLFSKFHDVQCYEGVMARNAFGGYENKRSYNLQKVKFFQEEDFEIIDTLEGRGKLQGHVGAFVCKTKSGDTFQVKLAGDTSRLAAMFSDTTLWRGRLLSVQFQDYTNGNVPRFPVGKAIRDYE